MIYIPGVVFIPILAVVAWFDFKKKIIPNKITYPAAVLAILLNIFFSDISMKHIFAGGLMAFFIAFILMYSSSLGGGDLKLMTVLGLLFGYPWFIAAFIGGFMIGGMIAFVTKIAKHQSDSKPPLGFYLAISGIVVSGWLIFVTFPG